MLYGLIVGFVIYRNLTLKDMWEVLASMTSVTAVVFLILATATILSWVLTSEQIPQQLASAVLAISENKYLVLLFINILLLVVGCFMDQTAALIILGPVLAPLAIGVGVHPMQFGIIMCITSV